MNAILSYMIRLITTALLVLFYQLITHPVSAAPIIIDHESVSFFNTIPTSVISTLTSTTGPKYMLRHASVGNNISGGLNSLQTTNQLFNRVNIVFQDRGNPGWQAKVDDLVTQTAAQLNNFSIFSMKLCYIDDNIMNSFTGCPGCTTGWDYYRTKMLQLEATYPQKKFVWWTIPLMTTNNAQRNAFNQAVRTFITNSSSERILFDIADIESDGFRTIINGQITNEVLFAAYSSDGGHLTTLGADHAAKAHWYMLARLSGWNSAPTNPYDFDTDGDVDYVDLKLFLPHFTSIFVFNQIALTLPKY